MPRPMPIIPPEMSDLSALLDAAVADGKLLPAAKTNLEALLAGSCQVV